MNKRSKCDYFLGLGKSFTKVLSKNYENYKFKFDDVCLKNSNLDVILGVIIDNKLTFNNQMKIFLEKAFKNSVRRQEDYLSKKYIKKVFKEIIKSKFN